MPTEIRFGKDSSAVPFDFIEQMLYGKGYRALCGVDEVGRGPLAGPVVAAAVIVPPGVQIEGIDDSKRLTAIRREELFEEIARLELKCAVGVIDNAEIDRLNIHKASLMAMRKALQALDQRPDFVIVDGNFAIPNVDQPQFAVVGGDRRCQSVAAASVVAKVTRDRIMIRYQELYPSFSFARHKGYPTPLHLDELQRHGPCDIHRKTFRPVTELMEQYALL